MTRPNSRDPSIPSQARELILLLTRRSRDLRIINFSALPGFSPLADLFKQTARRIFFNVMYYIDGGYFKYSTEGGKKWPRQN